LRSHAERGNEAPRQGFTLIELLIVITIIGILAALVVGVASIAAQSGREAKTRNIIGRIHTLVNEHYNTYKNRRIELRETGALGTGIEQQIAAAPSTTLDAAEKRTALQEARLMALREIVLMDMPDRWSDVWLGPLPPTGASLPLNAPVPYYNSARTPLSENYLRRFRSLYESTNSITNAANTLEDIQNNQGAECLYMIVMTACGDGEARTLFHENDIGDADGDGAREFLDAWGRPVNYLRWAPGFNSQIQLDAPELMSLAPAQRPAAIAADHDPLDVFRVDATAYRLVPLIYSSGRDEAIGLRTEDNYVTWPNWTGAFPSMAFNNTAPHIRSPRLTPYVSGGPPTAPLALFGSDNGQEAATDNIHNHLIGRRL
jgi:prepilin-type N-terminal cleavage/methylation domain-containing protein